MSSPSLAGAAVSSGWDAVAMTTVICLFGNAQGAVGPIIGSIPNLLATLVVEKFTHERCEVAHSPREVAEPIAVVLPSGLRELVPDLAQRFAARYNAKR